MKLSGGRFAVHDPRVTVLRQPVLNTQSAPGLTVIGTPGVTQPPTVLRPHFPVPFLPDATFTAEDVAQSIANSIVTASAPPLTIPVPDGSGLIDGMIETVNDNGTIYVFDRWPAEDRRIERNGGVHRDQRVARHDQRRERLRGRQDRDLRGDRSGHPFVQIRGFRRVRLDRNPTLQPIAPCSIRDPPSFLIYCSTQ